MKVMEAAVLRTMAALSLFVVGLSMAEANQVGFIESSISAGAGQSFTVHLVGSGFSSGPEGAGFSLSWDESVLEYLSTAVANPPWDTSVVESSSAGSGLLDFVFLGKSVGDAGSNFEITSFTFNVVGNAGDSTLLSVADVFGGFVKPGGQPIFVNYVASQVQVVPLPAAVWMFGAGLVGMMGSVKRRKQ